MPFVLTKTLPLDRLGDDWKGCYMTFHEPTVSEMQRIASNSGGKLEKDLDSTNEMMRDCFVEGKAFNGTEIVNVKGDELKDLPYSIYKECLDFLLSVNKTE
jgi:hypothetical protein